MKALLEIYLKKCTQTTTYNFPNASYIRLNIVTLKMFRLQKKQSVLIFLNHLTKLNLSRYMFKQNLLTYIYTY